MRWKLLDRGAPATYAVVLAHGDEAIGALQQFVREQQIDAAALTAIGAFERAVIGYFDWDRKDYKRIPVDEQVEVLSLLGDVAEADGKPALHVHVVLGRSDGSVVGGHLLEGQVRPTLEVILTRPPAHLRKKKDPETGLALIALDMSQEGCQRRHRGIPKFSGVPAKAGTHPSASRKRISGSRLSPGRRNFNTSTW